MSERTELLEFPCRFPIKVMGAHHEEFVATIVEVVRVHAPDLLEADVLVRASAKGNFLALTLHVNATSREQLDAIYMALSGHPMVSMAL